MAKTPATTIQRGYARGPSDEKRLQAAGVKTIYRADKGETPGKFKMRAGELLGVVDGLRALGQAKSAMVAAVDMVHGWGAVIVDVGTGLRSDRDGAKMMSHAFDTRTSDEFREMQAKAVADRHKRNGRMPKEKARVIWFNDKLNKDEAAERCGPGWSWPTLYRHFGKRNAPRGA